VSLPCGAWPEAVAVSAFAAGAAIGWLEKKDAPDFRIDNLPSKTYLSARNKALYGLSAAIVFLLLSLLLVINAHTGIYQNSLINAKEQMEKAYNSVSDKPATGSVDIVREMRNKSRRLRSRSHGQSDQAQSDSAGHTFMLIMQALAGLGEQFDLKIDMLRLMPKDARLAGSIPDLKKFEKLQNAIKQQPPLDVGDWSFDPSTPTEQQPRREFEMTIFSQAAKKNAARKGK
jgi:hypothetical protein